MTWFEFKATLSRQLPPDEEERLREFFESVLLLSDDYEGLIARMRASGKFKSIFGDLGTSRPINMTTDLNNVLSERERKQYPTDLYKTIIAIAETGRKPPGMCTSISSLLARANSDFEIVDDRTLLVPMEVLAAKALNVTSAPVGGFLVGSDVGSKIEMALRPASVCIKAGAQVLPGLRADLTLGRESASVTFEWLHELETLTATDASYGSTKLTPRRISGCTSLSTTLKAQAAPDISGFIVQSLSKGISSALDAAALNGLGVGGEPLGIFNRSGVLTVTFGGAATMTTAADFENQLTGADISDDGIVFVAEPAVRKKWRTLARFSGAAKALWEDDDGNFNICAGRPAFVSTSVPATKILAGDFSKMIFGFWGDGSPVQVLIDPFTSKKSGIIEIQVTLMADVGVIRENAFCVSSDSAIQ